MRPDLHQVLPAPNFLPGLVIRKEISRSMMTNLEVENYVVDDAATIANLRGEDIDGHALESDDPRALHNRWMWELEQQEKTNPEPFPNICKLYVHTVEALQMNGVKELVPKTDYRL